MRATFFRVSYLTLINSKSAFGCNMTYSLDNPSQEYVWRMYYRLFDSTVDKAEELGITVDLKREDNPSVPYINTLSTSRQNPTAALPLAASNETSGNLNISITTSGSQEPSYQATDQEERPYRYIGVFLPVQSREDAPNRVTREWPRIHDGHLASEGFLLGGFAQVNNYVLFVQSIRTGDLLVHKLIKPSSDGLDEPAELRISTWQDTLSSAQVPKTKPSGVLPQDAPFFNKLKFWQHYTPDADAADQATAYSLYFE